MTTVCDACEGQGSHARPATAAEGGELAYDECEVCKGRGVVFEEPETLLGVADHESFDWQAEMGQGPPA